jgi:hypothetical protein
LPEPASALDTQIRREVGPTPKSGRKFREPRSPKGFDFVRSRPRSEEKRFLLIFPPGAKWAFHSVGPFSGWAFFPFRSSLAREVSQILSTNERPQRGSTKKNGGASTQREREASAAATSSLVLVGWEGREDCPVSRCCCAAVLLCSSPSKRREEGVPPVDVK